MAKIHGPEILVLFRKESKNVEFKIRLHSFSRFSVFCVIIYFLTRYMFTIAVYVMQVYL